MSRVLTRRGFLASTAALPWVAPARHAFAQPQAAPAPKSPPVPQTPPAPAAPAEAAAPTTPPSPDVPYGISPLGLSDGMRDGSLYVPKSYRDETPMPVLVMLHGYSGWGDEMKSTFQLAEEFGVVIVAPDSRDVTWGRSAPGFDQDVRFISAAFRKAVQNLNLDPDRVGLGGRSDGAGYALSMGLAYGDTFNHVISIAGGMMAPVRRKGQPKIFIAHGTTDQQMPIERTGRLFQQQLKDEGYEVTYREYDGGHATPVDVVREAFAWLTGKPFKPAL